MEPPLTFSHLLAPPGTSLPMGALGLYPGRQLPNAGVLGCKVSFAQNGLSECIKEAWPVFGTNWNDAHKHDGEEDDEVEPNEVRVGNMTK